MQPEFRIAAKIGETIHDCHCGKPECAANFVKEFYVAVFILSLEGHILEGPDQHGPFQSKEKAQKFLEQIEKIVRSGDGPIHAVKKENLH